MAKWPDEMRDLISHVLTADELEFTDTMVYRDLGLLEGNRPKDGDQPCEIIVVDVEEAENCSDVQTVNYLQGQEFNGNMTYDNLQ